MENIDIFDKYMRKQMNSAEILQFENDMETDPALKEEFELYKISTELIKLDNLKKEVTRVHNSFTEKKKYTFPIIRIAAMLAFGLIGYTAIWANTNNGTDILENKQINYIEPVHRGELEKKTNTDSLYSIGDFKHLIEVYKTTQKPDEKFTFLTAMAYYNSKKYDESLTILQKINTNNSAFENEIPYYVGQCQVGLNKYDEAIKTFENLAKSNPYAEQYDWKYKLKLHALKFKF
jgi:tetratricopeptide (TPR) repeat protein